MFKISGNISSDILKWFDEKENEFNKDISATEIFDFHKDQKLKRQRKLLISPLIKM